VLTGVYLGVFEQSVLLDHPTNKRWSVLASLTGELALLSVLVLVPLAYTDRLPVFEWKAATLSPPPGRSPDVKPARMQGKSTTVHAAFQHQAFIYPQRRLPDISNLSNDPVAIEEPPGVEGSIGQRATTGPLLNVDPKIEPPSKKTAAAEKPPEKTEPMRVGGDVQMAKLIRQVKPEYPALARIARIYGVVHLVGVIGKDDTIQNLQVISGHPLLARAALDAVRGWIYKPTLLNGQPVEVTAPIDVNFTLSQ